MKITKGTVLTIKHDRKGIITVIADEGFDTDRATFYPVNAAVPIAGRVNEYLPGDRVPCRATMCRIISPK